MNKQLFIGAAITGLISLGGCASGSKDAKKADAPATAKKVMGECHGVNSCKGTGDCGGKGHSCAGKNSCKGKGWEKASQEECAEKGGKFKG